MKISKALVALVLALAVLASPSPIRAEHLADSRPGDGAGSLDVDLDLRFDSDGFRLGGRIFGNQTLYGAWLNGRVRRDGLSLDGRLEGGRREFTFRWDLQTGRRDVDR